jgi:hypothetical protein
MYNSCGGGRVNDVGSGGGGAQEQGLLGGFEL